MPARIKACNLAADIFAASAGANITANAAATVLQGSAVHLVKCGCVRPVQMRLWRFYKGDRHSIRRLEPSGKFDWPPLLCRQRRGPGP